MTELCTQLSTDDPIARLRAFAADSSNPAEKRAEAEAVLKHYEERARDIEGRMDITVTVTPLGMLLRVPDEPRPTTPCPGWCGGPAGEGGRLCGPCFTRFNAAASHGTGCNDARVGCGCEECLWVAVTLKCIRGDWTAETAERIRREASS